MVKEKEEPAINAKNPLQPNQRLEVFIGKKDHYAVYKTRVEEVTADKMMLAMPMDKGFPIILTSGETFKGKFIKNGAVYQFECRYLDKLFTPIPVWITSIASNFDKIQLRDHVRVEVSIKACLEIIEEDQMVEISTITKDLSGGGALVISRVPLPPGKPVTLKFELPDFGEVRLPGEVIRTEQPKLEQQLYWVGIKFSIIPEKLRNVIIRYVFKTQVQLRKKGL